MSAPLSGVRFCSTVLGVLHTVTALPRPINIAAAMPTTSIDNPSVPRTEIRAILFDWGNTLARVHREDEVWQRCARAAVDAAHAAGLQSARGTAGRLRDDFVTARARTMADPQGRELGSDSFFRQWLEYLAPGNVGHVVVDQTIRAFWNEWTDCLDLLDDADRVLASLRARGLVLGIVSNVVAPGSYCRRQLQRLGLLDHLSTITFSSEVGLRKPREEVYRHAVEQLAALAGRRPFRPEQILFVGDSPACDVTGPARLGMQTALLVHPELKSHWPAEDYQRIKPSFRITHLSELEHILTLNHARIEPQP